MKRCVAGSTEREAEIFGIDLVSIFSLYSGIGLIILQGPGYIRGEFDVLFYLCTSPPRLARYDIIES